MYQDHRTHSLAKQPRLQSIINDKKENLKKRSISNQRLIVGMQCFMEFERKLSTLYKNSKTEMEDLSPLLYLKGDLNAIIDNSMLGLGRLSHNNLLGHHRALKLELSRVE